MKKLFLIISLFLTDLTYAQENCSPPQDANIGNPVVMVSPKVSKDTSGGACALVSFMLKEKPGTEGKALMPTSIEVEKITDKKLAEPVKKAMSKWLYFNRSHNTSTKYYYSYVFIAK